MWRDRFQGEKHWATFYLDDLLLDESKKAAYHLANTSHLFVTANESLKEEFLKINPNWNIRIARTHIDVHGCDEVESLDMPDHFDGRYKILWASSGRVGLSIMKKVLEKADKLNDFKDVTIFTVANQVGLARKELYQYDVDVQYMELMPIDIFIGFEKRMDLLINPMHSDDVIHISGPEKAQSFIDCKSEVKFCHSGALKIPLITSPQKSYLYAGKHEKNMLVANTTDDWLDYILTLKRDQDYSTKLASGARERVEREYDTSVRAKRYLHLFTGGHFGEE